MSLVSESWRAQKRREYLRSIGRPPLVKGAPVEKVRAKYRSYRERGMSVRQMREQTGLPDTTISGICDGGPALLWATFDGIRRMRFEPPDGQALISITPSRRRLGALWHDGFTLEFLAERLGVVRPHVQKMLREAPGRQITAELAARVERLYDELDGRKADEFGIPARTVKYCRAFAAKKGYAPRTCWDPDTIDDPDAFPEWTGACGTPQGIRIHYRERIPPCKPCLDARERSDVQASSAVGKVSGARLRAIRELRGLSLVALAERLGVHRDTVYYWEAGRSSPRTQEMVDKIVTTLGCNYDDIREEDV